MKRINKYILFLVVLFVGAVAIESTAPKPVSWEESFTGQDKVPFGTYILRNILQELFPGAGITSISMPAYNALENGSYERANYIFVNSTFTPDELDVDELLLFVERGNRIFVAASSFSEEFADTLGFGTYEGYRLDPFTDTASVDFTSPKLKGKAPYIYKKHLGDAYFDRFDTLRSTVLGVNSRGEANFIRIIYGEGEIYLSSLPYAFTNYHLIDEKNASYAFKALSYLPDGDIFWDEYYKAGRREVDSPLRFLLSKEALRWSYYLTMAGVLLFVIFMGRRRQRIIPEIRPLPNTTLEFAETVGQLYYQHGDHKNIAEKKVLYFLEHIRSHFGVNTSERNEEFNRVVAARSGIDLETIQGIFGYVDRTLEKEHIGEEELIALNKAIERFYAASRR